MRNLVKIGVNMSVTIARACVCLRMTLPHRRIACGESRPYNNQQQLFLSKIKELIRFSPRSEIIIHEGTFRRGMYNPEIAPAHPS